MVFISLSVLQIMLKEQILNALYDAQMNLRVSHGQLYITIYQLLYTIWIWNLTVLGEFG
jgi:hypothetical protein